MQPTLYSESVLLRTSVIPIQGFFYEHFGIYFD